MDVADNLKSHPSRVRGLKPGNTFHVPGIGLKSHPSRVRGLKPAEMGIKVEYESHPSRVRGLKQIKKIIVITGIGVAPFAGAWIETSNVISLMEGMDVAPFAGAWIETNPPLSAHARSRVAPFAGAWIETSGMVIVLLPTVSRTLRGCVD